MYAKLDKLRDDLKKAIAKRDAADAKVKQLETKLKEEENLQIVSDVASYNLSPEQLAQFLQLAGSGRLQELLGICLTLGYSTIRNGYPEKASSYF